MWRVEVSLRCQSYQEHPLARAWVRFARCQGIVGRRGESSRGCSHCISHSGQELGERLLCSAKEQELFCIMPSSLPFLSVFSSTPPSSNVNCPFWAGIKTHPHRQKRVWVGASTQQWDGGLASGRDTWANQLPWRRLRRSVESAQCDSGIFNYWHRIKPSSRGGLFSSSFMLVTPGSLHWRSLNDPEYVATAAEIRSTLLFAKGKVKLMQM